MAFRPTDKRRTPSRRSRPRVESLEPRELNAVTAVKATVVPQVLVPQNNRWVPILIQGTVTTNQKEIPGANFQLLDQYHEYNRVGYLQLTPADSSGKSFHFTLVLHLRAKVSVGANSARHYYLVLAAKDSEGANGIVVPIIVPPLPNHLPAPHRPLPARLHPVGPLALAAHRTR